MIRGTVPNSPGDLLIPRNLLAQEKGRGAFAWEADLLQEGPEGQVRKAAPGEPGEWVLRRLLKARERDLPEALTATLEA